MTRAVTDPASNDDSFAEDSPPLKGAAEDELDQLLAEVSLKTAALQQEVAGDSASTSGGGHSPESDSPAPADQKADVEVQIADVEALVSAAKIDVGPEFEESAAPAGDSSLPPNASESVAAVSDDPPVLPDRPAAHDAGSSVRIPLEYSEDTSETASGESEVHTLDRVEIDEETPVPRLTAPSVWGHALLIACLNLIDMLDRRMGWLRSGPRRILGIAAVATLVTAVALWIVSFVVSPVVPT